MGKKVQLNALFSSFIIFAVCGVFVFLGGSYINSVNAAVSQEAHAVDSFVEESNVGENASRIRYVTKNVVSILKYRHYRSRKHDNDFSHLVFDKYIEMLDPGCVYFSQEDLKKLSEYYDRLDEDLEKGNADFAFVAFDIYKKRLEEYRLYAEDLLKKDFDFTVDENIVIDRSKVARAANDVELHELWRKDIKNSVLNMRLYEKMMAENHDKKESDEEKQNKKIRELWGNTDPRSRIIKHLKDVHNELSQKNVLDVLDIYLTAVAQVYGPHSSYLSPKSNEDFDIRMSLSLSGIGATLTSEDGLIRIVEIVPGGPAALDGRLKKEDRIIGVGQGKDGEIVDVVNMSVSNAVKLIRGKENTIVRLAILPGDQGRNAKPQIIELVRKKVELKESGAKGTVHTVGQKKIGVITIPSFYRDFSGEMAGDKKFRSVSKDVDNILKSFAKEKVDSVVIDLRTNGGGSLIEAIQLSGLFIKKGPVVQTRSRNGQQHVNEDSDNGYIAYTGPLVVLNSRMSASASEIFSAAMQDYDRAVIVGDSSSYGKGTVLEVLSLNELFSWIPIKFDAGSMQYESAVFYRVTGASVQQFGVASDIVIPSLSEPMEIGERHNKNHLPWDEIDSCEFKKYYNNFDDVIAELKIRSAKRIETDQDFNTILNEQKVYLKLREENVRSLNEKKRYEEYLSEKKLKDGNRKNNPEISSNTGNGNDAILREALNIAGDLADLL